MDIKRANNNHSCEINEKNDVPYITFPIFPKGEVVHGFSTRLGGVSRGIWESMNLSFSRGDEEKAVRENFRRIGDAIGFSPDDLVFTDQVHETTVMVVTEEHKGMGMVKPKPERVDGLVTNIPGIPLATFYADCVPLFFYDPVKKVVGTSHSGWRGTVAGMGAVTIEKMQQEYGCCPADILVAIGPSICKECYEISADVAEAFELEFGKERSIEFLRDDKNGKYHLDLWRVNEIILEEAGVVKEHICTTDLCTNCNPELLFSHRASQGKRGNLAGFIMIKD